MLFKKKKPIKEIEELNQAINDLHNETYKILSNYKKHIEYNQELILENKKYIDFLITTLHRLELKQERQSDYSKVMDEIRNMQSKLDRMQGREDMKEEAKKLKENVYKKLRGMLYETIK